MLQLSSTYAVHVTCNIEHVIVFFLFSNSIDASIFCFQDTTRDKVKKSVAIIADRSFEQKTERGDILVMFPRKFFDEKMFFLRLY